MVGNARKFVVERHSGYKNQGLLIQESKRFVVLINT